VGTHWELEEHVESPLIEMQWELNRNIVGKNKNPTLPPPCKRQKKPGLWVHAASLIGYKKCFCVSVLFVIFGLV
jgi:hypothetical protein